jgi:CBS domain-containing protein
MSRNVVVANTTDTVQHILTLIMESGFSAFPVQKKKKLVGIVSRIDLLRGGRVRAALAHAAQTPVEKIMTKDVISIGPEEKIRTAADLLVRHDVSRLPVIDKESIVGIVDRHDVLAGLR